ncbi:MAG TPA: tetratricopeptide repeat protein [Lacipirellula sp.]
MNFLVRTAKACWNAYATAFSWVAGALLSNRALALALLAGSVVLVTGPWLRSSVSRDFRGVHIPWTNTADSPFMAERVAEAPRQWRWDSIAVPLLAIVAVGAVVVFVKPRWSSHVFGMLLAVSIPALAVSLWNHPSLFDFFESEIRGRQMLRTVFRHQNDDMMTARAPDRLQAFGGQHGKIDLLEPTHPMLVPFRYWMYGPWLVTAAAVGVLATRRGAWSHRMAYAGLWAGAGVALALAATWPRWLAEYHWARADALASQNRFAEADVALEQARASMPHLGALRRYWVARGRLDYRQQRAGPYHAFFVAYQYLMIGDLDRARSELEPYVHIQGETAQRDMLAEIIGHIAASFAARGQDSAAEIAWREASNVAPWKPSYWVAEAVTELAATPARAEEIEQRVLDRLCNVGDCFVGSDVASALGDAYFEMGEFDKARDMYAKAMELFHLPKYVNLPAQEGRLGM